MNTDVKCRNQTGMNSIIAILTDKGEEWYKAHTDPTTPEPVDPTAPDWVQEAQQRSLDYPTPFKPLFFCSPEVAERIIKEMSRDGLTVEIVS